MARGDKTRAILRELDANPRRSSSEIARAAGVESHFVRSIASRRGISIGAETCPRTLSRENRDWVRRKAEKAGVCMTQMIDTLITELRLGKGS